MTKGQRIALNAEWWPAACRNQGCKTSDRDLRLRVCAFAISLPNPTQASLIEAINSDRQPDHQLESTSQLDNKADIDAVKACLGMLADNVKKTEEVGHNEIGLGRRRLYVAKQTADEAYVWGLLKSPRFKCYSLAELEQMSVRDFKLFMTTLTARMAGKKSDDSF